MSQLEETTKAEEVNVVVNNKDVADREVIVQTLNSLESAPRERIFWNILQMIVIMIFIVITFIICHIALHMKLSSTITVMSFVGGICCMIFITYNGWKSLSLTTVHTQKRSCMKIIIECAKIVWKKKSIYLALISHIADTSSDIGVIIEFNELRQSKLNDSAAKINYEVLFYLSVFIIIFYRIISSILFYIFSRRMKDALLQFLDVKLFDIVYISWKNKYVEICSVQRYIHLIEAIFESAPQLLITTYILIASNDSNAIIWISTVFSMMSIANRNIAEDTKWFKSSSHAQELEFSHKTFGCNWTRCCCCNFRFIIRRFWRYVDVITHVLLIAFVWKNAGGKVVLIGIGCEFLLLSLLAIMNKFDDCIVPKKGLCCVCDWYASTEWYVFIGLTSVFPASIDNEIGGSFQLTPVMCIIWSWIRHATNLSIVIFGIYLKWWQQPTVYAILLILVLANIYLYLVICGRYNHFVCSCSLFDKCKCNIFGKNWTKLNCSTTRSISGIDTLDELKELILFGYTMHEKSANEVLWSHIKEAWQIFEYIYDNHKHVDLAHVEKYGKNLLHYISENPYIINEGDIFKMYDIMINELKYDVNAQGIQWNHTPLSEAVTGDDKSIYFKVKALINGGADKNIIIRPKNENKDFDSRAINWVYGNEELKKLGVYNDIIQLLQPDDR
eukprot:256560_1